MSAVSVVKPWLEARGWQVVAPRADSDFRACFFRSDGSSVELEHRAQAGVWWFWVHDVADRRCFELGPNEQQLPAVLAWIAEQQHSITVQNYLLRYLALQKLCAVSIVAWEQFAR